MGLGGNINLGSGITSTTSGQLGLGTTAPSAQFQISSTTPSGTAQIIKGASSQTGNLLEFQNINGTAISWFNGDGNLVLGSNPTSTMGAATKQYVDQYVDNKFGSGVTSFNSRTGSVSLQVGDVTPLLTNADFSAGTITAAVVGNLTGSASGNVLKSGDSMTGLLFLSGDPTSAIGAATKQYVDIKVSEGVSGVSSFNGRTGAVSLDLGDVTTLLGTANFSSGTITATLIGNATSADTATTAETATNFSGSLSGDVTGTQGATTVSQVGGSTAANIHSAELLANAGTHTNTMLAGSIAYSKLSLTGAILNADLAGSISSSKLVGTDIATVGTITSGTWNGTLIGPTYGGTGVNNGSKTITLGGNLTTSGAFNTTLTATGTTSVTLPTAGTLATLANSETFTNKTMSGSSNTFTNIPLSTAVTGTLPNNNTTAQSTNTPSAIVARDGSGNFSAGTITATTFSGAFNGSATSLTSDASFNTKAGTTALANVTGSWNSAFGYNSLNANTAGNGNTAVGRIALQANTSGSFNTATGMNALYVSTTGSDNTAVGVTALQSNLNGSDNTGVGYLALGTNTTGNFNTALGSGADVGAASLSYATAIGAGASVGTSNTIALGRSGAQDKVVVAGNVGIGTTAPASTLQVAGSLATNLTTKTANYTITNTDSVVLGNASSGSITLTLPTAVGANGRQYILKKTDSSSNSVIIATSNSQTIDGAYSIYYLYQQNQAITLASDGSGWWTISTITPSIILRYAHKSLSEEVNY